MGNVINMPPDYEPCEIVQRLMDETGCDIAMFAHKSETIPKRVSMSFEHQFQSLVDQINKHKPSVVVIHFCMRDDNVCPPVQRLAYSYIPRITLKRTVKERWNQRRRRRHRKYCRPQETTP